MMEKPSHIARWKLTGGFSLLFILICFTTLPLRQAAAGSSSVVAQVQALSAADGGLWSNLITTQDVPVHISLLPDGRLLYWGRDKAADNWDIGGRSNTYLVDPLYPEPNYTAIPSPTPNTNLFCSGHSFLPDGRLLVSGGHGRPDQYPWAEGVGERALNTFDYRTNTWTRLAPDMPNGRWYPYNITLGNGETLTMSGQWWNGVSTGTIDGRVVPIASSNDQPDIRDLSGALRTLTDNFTGTFPSVPNYPYISLTSSGKVFIATPSDVAGSSFGFSRLLDPFATNTGGGKGVFTAVAMPSFEHLEGTSVMYAPDKVLLIGGKEPTANNPASNKVERIDLSAATPTWITTGIGQMNSARHYPTATLLPDGKVLVTGGTSCPGTNNVSCGGAVQSPEMWDPANPSVWKTMNATTSGIPRVYHSFAMLMPDARVLVGGGGLPLAEGETGTNGQPCPQAGDNFPCRLGGHKNVEYFSPPYLFKADGTTAARPAITSAPDSIAYGQGFSVGIGGVGATENTQIVLIRLPSVTHTFNQDQRRVVLSSTRSGDSLSVTAPANGNACPPGPYMMFLVRDNNGRNTPSIAKIVRVGNLSIDRTSQAFPTTSTLDSLNGVINVTAPAGLNWTVQADTSWVTITNGTNRVGSGMVNFTVAPNTASGATRRKGKILIKVVGQDLAAFEFKVYQSVDFTDVSYPTCTDPMNPTCGEFPRAINKMFSREITSGCTVTAYCPANSITRAEMAVFIARVLRGTSSAPPQPVMQRFGDVPLGYWAGSYIDYIARVNVTNGNGGFLNGLPTYGPDETVTRAQMAVFIVRALGMTEPPPPATQRFDDVPLNYWAVNFIEELARRGITRGCSATSYCPDQPVSRDQMAVFLVRAFGL